MDSYHRVPCISHILQGNYPGLPESLSAWCRETNPRRETRLDINAVNDEFSVQRSRLKDDKVERVYRCGRKASLQFISDEQIKDRRRFLAIWKRD